MSVKNAAIIGNVASLCVFAVIMWLDVLDIAKPGREPWMIPVGRAAGILFMSSGAVIVGSILRSAYLIYKEWR